MINVDHINQPQFIDRGQHTPFGVGLKGRQEEPA